MTNAISEIKFRCLQNIKAAIVQLGQLKLNHLPCSYTDRYIMNIQSSLIWIEHVLGNEFLAAVAVNFNDMVRLSASLYRVHNNGLVVSRENLERLKDMLASFSTYIKEKPDEEFKE